MRILVRAANGRERIVEVPEDASETKAINSAMKRVTREEPTAGFLPVRVAF